MGPNENLSTFTKYCKYFRVIQYPETFNHLTMKKLFILFLFAITGASAQDVVKFSAEIKNRNSDSLEISSRKFSKVLKADAKGVIAGSFAVEPGFYQLNDGTEVTTLYLKNGYDLKLNMDAKMFDESIKYRGNGAAGNNLLAKRYLDNEEFFMKIDEFKEDNNVLLKAIDKRKQDGLAELSKAKDVDQSLRDLIAKQIEDEDKELREYADQLRKMGEMRGKPSPAFTFENHKGGTTSLTDLKGKYVYIDVWATWCAPCRAEIPYLQETEKKYHGKNIEFVSISVDTKRDYQTWKKMVADQSLGGIQLIADKDWKSDFVTSYGINGIPRFILIDPQGNVVDADAPRPSSPALVTKLDKLLK